MSIRFSAEHIFLLNSNFFENHQLLSKRLLYEKWNKNETFLSTKVWFGTFLTLLMCWNSLKIIKFSNGLSYENAAKVKLLEYKIWRRSFFPLMSKLFEQSFHFTALLITPVLERLIFLRNFVCVRTLGFFKDPLCVGSVLWEGFEIFLKYPLCVMCYVRGLLKFQTPLCVGTFPCSADIVFSVQNPRSWSSKPLKKYAVEKHHIFQRG